VRRDSQVDGTRVAETRESKFLGKEARSELQQDADLTGTERIECREELISKFGW
jgi:hypothetical protein